VDHNATETVLVHNFFPKVSSTVLKDNPPHYIMLPKKTQAKIKTFSSLPLNITPLLTIKIVHVCVIDVRSTYLGSFPDSRKCQLRWS